MIQTVEQYKEYLKSRLQPVSDGPPDNAERGFSRRLESGPGAGSIFCFTIEKMGEGPIGDEPRWTKKE